MFPCLRIISNSRLKSRFSARSPPLRRIGNVAHCGFDEWYGFDERSKWESLRSRPRPVMAFTQRSHTTRSHQWSHAGSCVCTLAPRGLIARQTCATKQLDWFSKTSLEPILSNRAYTIRGGRRTRFFCNFAKPRHSSNQGTIGSHPTLQAFFTQRRIKSAGISHRRQLASQVSAISGIAAIRRCVSSLVWN